MSATTQVLREVGYDGLTIAEIAARAGVGKQTIYRWWPSKAAIVTDCVLDGVVDLPLLTAEATGDTVEDLRAWLLASHRVVASPERGPLFRAMSAAAATDERAADQLTERFIGPLSTAIAQALDAGIAAGRIRDDVDTSITADILLATIQYAIITRNPDAADQVPRTLDTLLRGLGR